MSKGRLRGVPRNGQGHFKGTSRQFQKRFKQVSRVFEESIKCVSRKSKKKLQGCFKNVSRKCCFVSLLLHGSHHSYPSRRWNCLN